MALDHSANWPTQTKSSFLLFKFEVFEVIIKKGKNGKKTLDEEPKENLHYVPPEIYQTADGVLKYVDLFKCP